MSIIKLNNRGVKNASAFGSVTSVGTLSLIQKQTASSSSTISFTSGIDNSFKEYVFYFNNIHPYTNNVDFQFNASIDSGSNYNVSKTSTTFQAQHDEADSEALLQYNTDRDLANGTGVQKISLQIGNGNDECVSGFLHFFNLNSSTFVKHYMGIVNGYNGSNYTQELHTNGYINNTNSVDAIQFSFSSGAIDSGDILLFGLN